MSIRHSVPTATQPVRIASIAIRCRDSGVVFAPILFFFRAIFKSSATALAAHTSQGHDGTQSQHRYVAIGATAIDRQTEIAILAGRVLLAKSNTFVSEPMAYPDSTRRGVRRAKAATVASISRTVK